MKFLILFFTVFISIFSLFLVSATEYNGAGNYTLYPGDTIFFNEGYIVKYFNYQENAGYYYLGNSVTGNLATIALFNNTANLSYYGQNIYAIDVISQNKDKIKTFSDGFWFYVEPLENNNQEINLEVFIGSLSSCTDVDAYTIGNTVLEQSTGKWGLNYYKKGIATENKENISGKFTITETDDCTNEKLTEYYCDNGELKSIMKNCNCADDGSCKRGFFDAIIEWLRKTFGYSN